MDKKVQDAMVQLSKEQGWWNVCPSIDQAVEQATRYTLSGDRYTQRRLEEILKER